MAKTAPGDEEGGNQSLSSCQSLAQRRFYCPAEINCPVPCSRRVLVIPPASLCPWLPPRQLHITATAAPDTCWGFFTPGECCQNPQAFCKRFKRVFKREFGYSLLFPAIPENGSGSGRMFLAVGTNCSQDTKLSPHSSALASALITEEAFGSVLPLDLGIPPTFRRITGSLRLEKIKEFTL